MFAHQMPRLLGAIGALLYCGNVVGAINLNVDDPSMRILLGATCRADRVDFLLVYGR